MQEIINCKYLPSPVTQSRGRLAAACVCVCLRVCCVDSKVMKLLARSVGGTTRAVGCLASAGMGLTASTSTSGNTLGR